MIERSAIGRMTLALTCTVVVAACASGGGAGPRKEPISPQRGGQTLARYTPAIRTGDLVFFSGQIGSRPGEGLPPTVEEQTQQALANLENLMREAGVSKDDLVKCTVFLADIRDYNAMNAVYADFFEGTDPPARSAVGVAGLPAGARVEVECIAAAS